MRFISVLGMITLLLAAWAISAKRREVRLRPVVWGLALQFLFAVIILQENVWSFVGMALLGLLLIVYLLQQDIKASANGNLLTVLLVAAAIGGGALLAFLGQWVNLKWLLVLLA
ncbi:MAG: hypothetical protein IH972_00830, partial [Candidatus Marinimicrobia bacterium]|nr:hypothetical protein [Candidatus Neomarinimicrobiota bacterium]